MKQILYIDLDNTLVNLQSGIVLIGSPPVPNWVAVTRYLVGRA